MHEKATALGKKLRKNHGCAHITDHTSFLDQGDIFILCAGAKYNTSDLLHLANQKKPSVLIVDSSEKKNVKTSINRNRIGQQNFRINVLSAYKYQCCVTRSDLIDAIEANHIHPYFGVNTNHVQNGIPLRADIHKLWTKGLLGINDQFKVILSEKAKNSESYKKYHGQTIMLPTNPKYHPDKEALLRWCNLHELI